MNISTYKISPELNKGAVCFSTTDSSCHLPYDEALLAAATACQFYLLHSVTSDRSDFTNSLTQGPHAHANCTEIQSDTQTYSSMTFHCLATGIGDVAHLQLASGASLPAQIDIGHLTNYKTLCALINGIWAPAWCLLKMQTSEQPVKQHWWDLIGFQAT